MSLAFQAGLLAAQALDPLALGSAVALHRISSARRLIPKIVLLTIAAAAFAVISALVFVGAYGKSPDGPQTVAEYFYVAFLAFFIDYGFVALCAFGWKHLHRGAPRVKTFGPIDTMSAVEKRRSRRVKTIFGATWMLVWIALATASRPFGMYDFLWIFDGSGIYGMEWVALPIGFALIFSKDIYFWVNEPATEIATSEDVINCAKCGSLNRVPLIRPSGRHPRCGSCKQPLEGV